MALNIKNPEWGRGPGYPLLYTGDDFTGTDPVAG